MKPEQLYQAIQETLHQLDQQRKSLERAAVALKPAVTGRVLRMQQQPMDPNPPKKKRHLSPAARKKIAAAQKKRWKVFHSNIKEQARAAGYRAA